MLLYKYFIPRLSWQPSPHMLFLQVAQLQNCIVFMLFLVKGCLCGPGDFTLLEWSQNLFYVGCKFQPAFQPVMEPKTKSPVAIFLLSMILKMNWRDFPRGPGLRLWAPNVWDLGSIPGQGTRPHTQQLRSGAAKLRKKVGIDQNVRKSQSSLWFSHPLWCSFYNWDMMDSYTPPLSSRTLLGCVGPRVNICVCVPLVYRINFIFYNQFHWRRLCKIHEHMRHSDLSLKI